MLERLDSEVDDGVVERGVEERDLFHGARKVMA